MNEEKQLTIALLTEKLQKLSGKKVSLKESAPLDDLETKVCTSNAYRDAFQKMAPIMATFQREFYKIAEEMGYSEGGTDESMTWGNVLNELVSNFKD